MADYKVSVLRGNDYRTSAWSGGTTTEMSIAPKDSIYAERNFEWRLSSATVDLEESDFTSLPDYNRIILTLKGGIKLCHNGGEWLELPEFFPHAFDGGDETKSVGKVVDFNLMLRKGVCAGDVVPCLVKAGEKRLAAEGIAIRPADFDTFMIYCADGTLTATLKAGERYVLKAGETLKVEGAYGAAEWFLGAQADVSAVIAVVSYL